MKRGKRPCTNKFFIKSVYYKWRKGKEILKSLFSGKTLIVPMNAMS